MLEQTLVACSQCGQNFAANDLIQVAGKSVCAQCKPALISSIMAGAPAAGTLHYGGFWMRVLARMIDGLVLMVALIPLIAVAGAGMAGALAKGAASGNRVDPSAVFAFVGLYVLMLYLLSMTYEVVMTRIWGGTVGKLACGLRIIRREGGRMSWGQAIGRMFMYIVSGMLFSIGHLIAAFDSQKRALQDRVCSTLVVYKNSLQ